MGAVMSDVRYDHNLLVVMALATLNRAGGRAVWGTSDGTPGRFDRDALEIINAARVRLLTDQSPAVDLALARIGRNAWSITDLHGETLDQLRRVLDEVHDMTVVVRRRSHARVH